MAPHGNGPSESEIQRARGSSLWLLVLAFRLYPMGLLGVVV